ncbi:hypothetical protein P7F88_06915 [Vibrio hannami]|uniref:hypothetical protein n=1 Tax=Vibrio hannami TaxID=2717094 RepID=UPI00240F8971|nr:hypothetical protein [Vibrio hannami]MDG3085840.1 hypothetical protein [Vibrio hannami]
MKITHNNVKAWLPGLLTLLCASSFTARAEIQVDFSGFGTIGYTQSNKSYGYLVNIDDGGTFRQDSLLAGQLDIQFNPKFSATLQPQIKANSSKDSGWEGNIAWAFLSYRPTNDWLLRAGMLRVPGYLNSENRDVGVTYDYVRVPPEFDSLSPTYDYTGISINRSFILSQGDLFLDAYYGVVSTDWRFYYREDVGTDINAGSFYFPIDIELTGGALTYETEENTYIGGIHYAISKNRSDQFDWYEKPLYAESNGIGYYTYEGATPVDHQDVIIANLGADIGLGYDTRLAFELAARRTIGNVTNGQNSYTGYVSLRKSIGKWTPYIFYSQIKTDSDETEFYNALNSSSVPDLVPGSEVINASQKVMADVYQNYDQYSMAIGSSYRLTPTSKLKAEFMLSHIGNASSLVDTPSGTDISGADIAVFSLSYSFVF